MIVMVNMVLMDVLMVFSVGGDEYDVVDEVCNNYGVTGDGDGCGESWCLIVLANRCGGSERW